MITKNEEALLPRCLESVKDADEIVIVIDPTSTDRTEEIARSFGCRIFKDYVWQDDFAQAGNWADEKCSGDWILSIDADQFLEESGISEIRKVIEEAETRHVDVVDVKEVAEDKSSWHYRALLYRKNSAFWIGACHEYLNKLGQVRSEIKVYYGASPTHQTDPDKAFRIIKKQITKTPNEPRWYYYLAREHYYRADYVSAIYFWDFYVSRSNWIPELADAYLYLARCYWMLSRGDVARDMCVRAIGLNPNFKEALQFMSEITWMPKSVTWKQFAAVANNHDVLFVRAS